MLSEVKNGRLIPVDLISHLEYFYNTLDCDQQDSISNPFKQLQEYPAICYKVADPTQKESQKTITLFE